MLATSTLLLWFFPWALTPSAAAPPVSLCRPLPPCRAQASQVSGPSFAITQGTCDFRFTAARFMTGCDLDCDGGPCVPACETSNTLHVPETSSAVDLHRDLDERQHNGQFYLDARTADGGDRHSRLGLDTANVIFSVGHGAPHPRDPHDDELNVMGPPPDVLLSRLRVGDGEARYLLLASCQVMSHGPRNTCTVTPRQFACPQEYNPEYYRLDPFAHRNVFARWRPRIAAGLRMACAGSTLLYPGRYLSDQFWQRYRVQSQPVADSLLFAMAELPHDVPICLTHGRRVPARTPLFDRRFTTDRNRRALQGKGRYLHAMYPVHDSVSAKDVERGFLDSLGVRARPTTDVEDPPADWRPPILALESLPSPPPEFSHLPYGFRQVPHRFFADLGEDARGLSAQVHSGSRAVILRWSPHPVTTLAKALAPLGGLKLGELELFEGARAALTANPAVSSFVLRIDRVQRRAAESDVPECFEACRYVRLQKWVSLPVPGEPNIEVPMIGPGSEWVLASCPGGRGRTGGTAGGDCPAAGRDEMVLTFDLRSPGEPRSPQDVGIVPPINPVENARQRARLELQQRGYDIEGPDEKRVIEKGRPQIAYETPPVHCTQKLLFPFFRFTYTEVVPRHGTEPHEIVIEVPYYPDPGADGRTPQNRTCSPEPPSG